MLQKRMFMLQIRMFMLQETGVYVTETGFLSKLRFQRKEKKRKENKSSMLLERKVFGSGGRRVF